MLNFKASTPVASWHRNMRLRIGFIFWKKTKNSVRHTISVQTGNNSSVDKKRVLSFIDFKIVNLEDGVRKWKSARTRFFLNETELLMSSTTELDKLNRRALMSWPRESPRKNLKKFSAYAILRKTFFRLEDRCKLRRRKIFEIFSWVFPRSTHPGIEWAFLSNSVVRELQKKVQSH